MKAKHLLILPTGSAKPISLFLLLFVALLCPVGVFAQLHNQANLDYLRNLSTKSSLTKTELDKVRATMLAINNEARLNPDYRKQQGCKTALQLPSDLEPLKINEDLNKLAQEQADYQASIKDVTHDNRNYRDSDARMNKYLKNHPKPEACAGAMYLSEYPIGWMKSETHYRPTWNLDKDPKGQSFPVNAVGYGVAKNENTWYFTAIWSFVADPEANKDNLAFGKPARQSSEYQPGSGYDASKAVDGLTKGDIMNVAATNGNQSDWWEVDLGAVYDLDRVVVWNRTDCCWERLQNFTLLVSESPIINTNEVSGNGGKFGPLSPWTASMKNHTVAVNRRGRYVRIAGSKGLALAEVQVFGKAAAQKTDDNLTATVCSGKTYNLDKLGDIYDGNTKIGYGATGMECVGNQLVATVKDGSRLKYNGQPMKWSPAPTGDLTATACGGKTYNLDKLGNIYDGMTQIGYGATGMECVGNQLVATVKDGSRLKYNGQPMKWSPAPNR